MTATSSLQRWRRRIVWIGCRLTHNVPWNTELLFYHLQYQQDVRVIFCPSPLRFFRLSYHHVVCIFYRYSRVDWLFYAPCAFAVFTRARFCIFIFPFTVCNYHVPYAFVPNSFSRTRFICVLTFAFGGILYRERLLRSPLHALFIPVFTFGFASNYCQCWDLSR